MDFERFQAAWDIREYDEPCEKPIRQVATEIRREARIMKRRQRIREGVEILFGIFLILILVRLFSSEIPLMVRTGGIAVVAGVVFLVMTSQILRRRHPPTPLDLPIRKFLGRELVRIQRLIRIQRSVSLFFFLSMTAGIAFISFGLGERIQESILTLGVAAAALGSAVWCGHRLRHKRYLSQQYAIEQQLQILTSNGS